MYSIGIDVGGTFTDFFCFNHSNQQTFIYKLASTPEDPSEAVCAGLEALLTKYSIKPTEVSTIFHGTTVGTNSILEGKGAKVGLITNSGFRDICTLADIKGHNTTRLDRKSLGKTEP